MRRALLLLVGLLLPAATAASAWTGTIDAGSIELKDDSSLTSALAALVMQDGEQPGPQPSPRFVLQAENLHLETDVSDPSVWTQATRLQPNGATTPQDFGASLVQGTNLRAGFQLVVLPTEGSLLLSSTSGCNSIAAPQATALDIFPKARPSRGPIHIDVARDLELTCSAESTLQIHGNLRLILWEVDGTLESDGNTQNLVTGQQSTTTAPGTPDARPTVSRDVQAFLTATNATLLLPYQQTNNGHLFLGPVAVQGAKGVSFSFAHGTLQDTISHEVKGTRVDVEGSLDLLIQRSGGNVAAAVGGQVDAVTIDGEKAAWATTSIAAPSAAPAWLAWSFAVAAALAVLAWLFLVRPQRFYAHLMRIKSSNLANLPAKTWRQRHAAAFVVVGEHAHHAGHAMRALLSSWIAFAFHHHPQALILRAKAYRQLSRPRTAVRIHKRLDLMLKARPRDRARNAWQAAQTAAAYDLQEAKRLRALCLRYDSFEYLRLVETEPGRIGEPRPVRGGDLGYA